MKVRLYAKPKRAPKWWPRDEKGRIKWVGVFSDGTGWVQGDADTMTEKKAKSMQRNFAEEQFRPFVFQCVPIVGRKKCAS